MRIARWLLFALLAIPAAAQTPTPSGFPLVLDADSQTPRPVMVIYKGRSGIVMSIPVEDWSGRMPIPDPINPNPVDPNPVDPNPIPAPTVDLNDARFNSDWDVVRAVAGGWNSVGLPGVQKLSQAETLAKLVEQISLDQSRPGAGYINVNGTDLVARFVGDAFDKIKASKAIDQTAWAPVINSASDLMQDSIQAQEYVTEGKGWDVTLAAEALEEMATGLRECSKRVERRGKP